MTEQPPGGPPQERLPEGSPEERLPATRPSSVPAPSDRFTAPPSAHRNDLTPERAARIVRQSASARWVGLIAVIIVSLFVIGYYFYELGLPGGISKSRLEAALEAEQVTSIERGYNIYQANCARCHGPNGEGGIGPDAEQPGEAVRAPQPGLHPQHAPGRRPLRLRRPEQPDAGVGEHGHAARTAELQAGRGRHRLHPGRAGRTCTACWTRGCSSPWSTRAPARRRRSRAGSTRAGPPRPAPRRSRPAGRTRS